MDAVDVLELVWVEADEVESVDVAQVIEFGRRRGMTFKVIEGRQGILLETERDERFVYYPANELPQGFHIPHEADRRLDLVGINFPIQQIIIADDLRQPPTFGEVAQKTGRATLTVAGVVAAAAAVVAVAIAAAILYDPKLIVVINDRWISIAEWV